MRRANLLGAGAIASWAFLALLSRAAAAVPPFELVAICFAVSGGSGLLLLAASGRLRELRQPPWAWAHGIGGLFGFHALFFAALAWAPAAEANLLNYSWPLLVVLLSAWTLRRRVSPRQLLGVGLATAGCALLLGGGAHFSVAALPGYLAAAASATIWAFYSVLARRFRDVPTGAVAGFCAATALLAALCHVAFEPRVVPNIHAWMAAVALGLGPVGGAFFLWDIGMKRGDPRLLGTLAYAAPVASTLLLCATGYAPFTATLLAAAGLVAGGGLLAATASGAARPPLLASPT